MATYLYECPEHGQFEVVKPMADSGRMERCTYQQGSMTCGIWARRVYTANAIYPEGTSGDGYVFDSHYPEYTSKRPKSKRWV